MKTTLQLFLGLTMIFLVTICNPTLLPAQSKEELEKERKDLIKAMEKTNKYLQSTTKSKQTTLKDLKVINSQVENRKKIISNIATELVVSDKRINSNNKKIDSLKVNLEKLNQQYTELMRYTYLRQMSNNKWSYLLSSQNLNTFLLRWRYSKQFETFCEKKKEEINVLSQKINASNQEIKKIAQEKTVLLDQEKKQTTLLESDKQKKDKALKEISSKEANLKSELEKQKSEREKLNRAIEAIITEQLRKAREKAEAKTTASNSGRSNSKEKEKTLDTSAEKLSQEFSANKNKLPWPISSGYISSKFGTHPHAEFKGVTIKNDGIVIAAKGNKEVRSVFSGEIAAVVTVPDKKNVVIITHGNYFSVYKNLETVYVGQGSKVNTQQSIGMVTDDETGESELHFELWHEKTKLNPESWLR